MVSSFCFMIYGMVNGSWLLVYGYG
jgi:hypothetical protein